MKRFAILTTIVAAVLTLVLPFVGGGGPSIADSTAAYADLASAPMFSSSTAPVGEQESATDAGIAAAHVNDEVLVAQQAATSAALKVDTEHLAQKPVPVPVVVAPPASKGGSAAAVGATRRAALAAAGQSCPAQGGGGGSAPGASQSGIAGTTSGDIQSFSAAFNSIRAANCLQAIPAGNFRYDSCMEARLFWMAEDPSTDFNSAWGHKGTVTRSDGVPDTGCDGNLAGGSGNSGATVAQKWWTSTAHRNSLYKPSFAGSTAGVCIYFAMTHGGTPNEPYGFTRAAARWGGC
jgi:hypothetical protein